LIHTDVDGTHDMEPPADERIYLIAGHQHGAGAAAVSDTTPIKARGANPFNMVDGSTVERAFLVNLDAWASQAVEPPPSAFPRLADGTAITREAALDQLSKIDGLALLDPAQLPTLRRVDLGPEVDQGIGRLPVQMGQPFPSFVPAVDADGNDIAGIRLPDISVPVATHTGWNPRHPDTGGEGQVLDMMGTSFALPREVIDQRYRDRAAYAAQARNAAEQLAAQRYILAEDVELVVELAAQRYDVLAPSPVAT